MKTLKWMMLFMAVTTMPLLTGCSKDNDDNDNDRDKTPVDVSGAYIGKISNGLGENDATAVLTKTGDNYSLSLTDLNIITPQMQPMNGAVIGIGDVTILNVSISDGSLSGGNEISLEVTLPPALAQLNGGVEKVTLKVSLESGIVSGDNLKFTLVVSDLPIMGETEVNFNGDKGEEKEKEKEKPTIAGAYTGIITVVLEGSTLSENDAITAMLTKTGDNYSLLLKDLVIGLEGMGAGSIKIGDVTFTNITGAANGNLSGGDVISREVNLSEELATLLEIPTVMVDVSFTDGTVSGNNLIFNLLVTLLDPDPEDPDNPEALAVGVNFDGNK